MKLFIVGAFVVLGVTSMVCHAQTTTEEMVSSCRAISDAKVSEGKVMLPTDFDSGVCWGAFAAVQQMTRIVSSGRVLFGVCAPEASTRTQLIQIFEEYAKRHPAQYQEPFIHVAQDALREAFPCKT